MMIELMLFKTTATLGRAQEMTGQSTQCFGLVGVVVFGQRLGSIILEVFSKLDDTMIFFLAEMVWLWR